LCRIPQFVAYVDLPHVKSKMIAVTQPRRVTTVSVADRVASEMDGMFQVLNIPTRLIPSAIVELGKEVGYSIRFDQKMTPGTTFIRYMTDGTLLQEAMYDPDFRRYSAVIIDEAHERTIATDILMVLLKSVTKRRPDLKIIIMSATLDAPVFQEYFSLDGVTRAPLLNIPGRSYPVEINYVKETPDDYVKKAIQVVLYTHTSDEQGDILLFLTGEDEIETTCQRINAAVDGVRKGNSITGPLDCIPLYSHLPPEKQQRIFDPPPVNQIPGGQPGRKVIVATNIAETSLTIDGIYFVIDCGFSKHKIHHPSLRMEYFRVKRISRASAQQRAGRAGRTGPGRCYRLYTEDEFEEMAEKTRPEVLNIDLSDAALKLLTIGINVRGLLLVKTQ
jgi:pre-mRNA-splicing factor ATP-dependent RNA helicase DHX15/PRP43